jgi:molecular chaperone HtpG
MEYFKDKDIEVLYFFDRIDEFITSNLTEFDGKKIQSISKGDFEGAETEEKKQEIKEKQESEKEILDAIKVILGETVKEVRFTNRLKTSAVCIVSGEGSVSLNMEKVLKDYDAFVPKAEKILEINPEHRLYAKIKELYTEDKDSDKFRAYTNMLLDQALLMEGLSPSDPVAFVNRLTDLMVD